ncbi:MAG: nitroreductase family protein [Candidatus Kariarchaeaceae archaeon]|jgi:SagB-type dehydrogenase family enzyme
MKPDELLDLIKFRRSIRKFSDQSIDKDIIHALLEAGQWGPTAGNKQPLEIVVVDQQEMKDKLVEAAGRQSFIAEAPIVFVIAANWERTSSRYGERGTTLYCLQDTAAAIQNILLLATSYRLGTCWIGAFNEEKAAEAVKLPPNFRPVAMIPIGHLAGERPEDRDPPTRRQLDEFVFLNSYNKPYFE